MCNQYSSLHLQPGFAAPAARGVHRHCLNHTCSILWALAPNKPVALCDTVAPHSRVGYSERTGLSDNSSWKHTSRWALHTQGNSTYKSEHEHQTYTRTYTKTRCCERTPTQQPRADSGLPVTPATKPFTAQGFAWSWLCMLRTPKPNTMLRLLLPGDAWQQPPAETGPHTPKPHTGTAKPWSPNS